MLHTILFGTGASSSNSATFDPLLELVFCQQLNGVSPECRQFEIRVLTDRESTPASALWSATLEGSTLGDVVCVEQDEARGDGILVLLSESLLTAVDDGVTGSRRVSLLIPFRTG